MKQTMRMVYVATPYAGLNVSDINRPFAAKKLAIAECQKVIKAGYIPISPVLAFGEVFDESVDRDKAVNAGLELLSHCSYIYFSTHADAARSQGMKIEREYANELGLTELDFDFSTSQASIARPCDQSLALWERAED
nr:MAG TPA: Blasticidin M [Caudoviricetes sp.]